MTDTLTYPDVVSLAVPFFIAAILFELIWIRSTGKGGWVCRDQFFIHLVPKHDDRGDAVGEDPDPEHEHRHHRSGRADCSEGEPGRHCHRRVRCRPEGPTTSRLIAA